MSLIRKKNHVSASLWLCISPCTYSPYTAVNIKEEKKVKGKFPGLKQHVHKVFCLSLSIVWRLSQQPRFACQPLICLRSSARFYLSLTDNPSLLGYVRPVVRFSTFLSRWIEGKTRNYFTSRNKTKRRKKSEDVYRMQYKFYTIIDLPFPPLSLLWFLTCYHPHRWSAHPPANNYTKRGKKNCFFFVTFFYHV